MLDTALTVFLVIAGIDLIGVAVVIGVALFEVIKEARK